MNQKQQSGFTLIELVMVIVILGILAATALPKFVDLKGEAATAAVKGVAGSLGAASAINKAAKLAGKSTSDWVPITACASAGSLLDGGLDTKFTLGSETTTVGSTVECSVTSSDGGSAKFVLHGV